MNARLLVAFLCLASVSTGCIIHNDDDDDGPCCQQPPPVYPGDVTFRWTLAGLSCDDMRNVKGVNIIIPGERLFNDGAYACRTQNVDGITLHDFRPGTYNYIIEVVDYSNEIIFEGQGTFTVNGDVALNIDLEPVGAAAAYLTWAFPGNMGCGQAGVASVDVTIDEQSKTFACNVGLEAPGVQAPYLDPGEHFIEFIARSASGQPLYYYNGSLIVYADRPVSAHYNLWPVGGASISWKFSDGSVLMDCQQLDPTGKLMVGVNFQDTVTGQWVYGALGDWHQCSSKPIIYSYLRPGTYKVSLYARTASGVEYLSNSNMAPILVQAHQFPGPGSALEVTMYRRQP